MWYSSSVYQLAELNSLKEVWPSISMTPPVMDDSALSGHSSAIWNVNRLIIIVTKSLTNFPSLIFIFERDKHAGSDSMWRLLEFWFECCASEYPCSFLLWWWSETDTFLKSFLLPRESSVTEITDGWLCRLIAAWCYRRRSKSFVPNRSTLYSSKFPHPLSWVMFHWSVVQHCVSV